MDWSLLQPNAKRRFLRDVRGYKNTWWYYLAMIIDPILRFNWIFYAIYTHDTRHGTMVSFFVAFSEVSRRGMWTLFRVENEHCANVARFKASRDIALPYKLVDDSTETVDEAQDGAAQRTETSASPATAPDTPTPERHHTATGAALEPQQSHTSSVRQRSGLGTFTRIFADAHTQDFEKKRKPGVGDSNPSHVRHDADVGEEHGGVGSSDEDDEEDDDEEDEQDARDLADANALLTSNEARERRES